jgi:hypothetical protein
MFNLPPPRPHLDSTERDRGAAGPRKDAKCQSTKSLRDSLRRWAAYLSTSKQVEIIDGGQEALSRGEPLDPPPSLSSYKANPAEGMWASPQQAPILKNSL